MILGLNEWYCHEISQFMRLPVWYLSHVRAAREGSDEPAHLRKIVSALKLNCEHRRNVDEGTFIHLG